MAMVATDIKAMLSIQIKSRPDSYSDQYNRLFMLKLLLVASLIMGISWFTDSINCIVPDNHKIDGGFVSATCWIQGFYIFTDLWNRTDETSYYGVTKDINMDGRLATGELCPMNPKLRRHVVEGCEPMEKTFFLQYHYMPFLVAAMIIPYYIPYIIHRTVNRDLINLKNAIKEDDVDADRLTKYFFSVFRHPTLKSCWLVICNIIIKILYIAVNIGVFLCLDYILNNKFRYYGNDWLEWGKLDNPVQHDYTSRLRNFPTPGNQLLPSFGYCEVANSAKDIKESTGNYHKVVCEISQHVLYQYTLLVLWVAILCGIIISVLGLVFMILYYLFHICIRARFRSPRGVRKGLCMRELEYLDFIHRKNVMLYGDVIEKLRRI